VINKLLLVVALMAMASAGHHAYASRTGMLLRIHADTLSNWSQTGGCTSVNTNLVFTETCRMTGLCACSGNIIQATATAYISSPCKYKWTLDAYALAGYRGGYVEASSSAVSGAQDGYQSYYYTYQKYCNDTAEYTNPFTFACIGPGSGGE
jgi:hypothetical protein